MRAVFGAATPHHRRRARPLPTLPASTWHDHPWARTTCVFWFWPADCPTSGTSRCAPAAGCSTRCAAPASTPTCATPTSACCPRCMTPSRPTRSSSRCTARPARTARCAACSTCASVPYVGATLAAARLAWDKPSAKSMLREAGIRHAGLGGAAARPVLRARRRRGARPDRRPARPAADGQAGPGRLGPGRRGGPRRRRPAGRDGRLLRVRLDRAGRAVRARAPTWRCSIVDLGDGPRPCRPSRSSRATACTTTRPATPPA